MRRLVLTTASVLALGMAGAGFGHAAGYPNASNGMNHNSVMMNHQSRAQGMMSSRTTGMVSRSEIKEAQTRLRDEGLYHGRIDGIVGSSTRTALRKFQERNGLPVTGRLTNETMASLTKSSTTGQGASMPSNTGANTGVGTGMTPRQEHSGTGGANPYNGSSNHKY